MNRGGVCVSGSSIQREEDGRELHGKKRDAG